MKYIFSLSLVAVLTIIQISLFPVSLILAFVFLMTVLFSDKNALICAFLAGLIFDLLTGLKIGYSSLAFLVVSEIILLYRRKLLFSNPFAVLIFSLIFYFIFQFLTGRNWSFSEAVFLALLALVIRIFLPNSFEKNPEKLKL